MKLKTYISRLCAVLITVLVVASGMKAQTFMHYNAALSYLQRGEVDSARVEIDLHMKELGSDKDPDSWYLCGFVYKEMYKKYEGTNPQSVHRMTALGAFEKSLALDTVAARMKLTRDNVRYLAGRYYNDAVATLDTVNFKISLACYENYRKSAQMADPMFDIKKKDVEFYLALASTYNTVYSNNKKNNVAYFDLTRDIYLKVLLLETLIVLSGIYYSLNEFDKSKAYQQMLDDLRKQK